MRHAAAPARPRPGRPRHRGPLAGRTVYEALQDPRLAALLLERLRSPGAIGPLGFHRAAAVPAGLPPRVLDAEQSNTSLVYGDAYILKVFRRIHPGVNPDLELPLASPAPAAPGSRRPSPGTRRGPARTARRWACSSRT